VRNDPRFLLTCLLLFLVCASDARADIVFFTTGRTMSVKSHRVEGEAFVFMLREGGDLTCPRAIVARITPDEVPYPEEAVEPLVDPATMKDPMPLAARPFGELIAAVSATHGVDARLVHAIVEVESRYQARARSQKGAKGLMQLMPDTARQYAVHDPYDPKTNLEAGVRHLKDLLSRFDLSLALAAYNAGEAVVRRHGGVPPFLETQAYVRQVLARLGR
jgi:hypothetical protein